MSDRFDDEVYERTPDGRFRKRGFPVVATDHPLWGAQRNRWDGYTLEEAWRAAVERLPVKRADSKKHPAYADDFLVNDQQARENADGAKAKPTQPAGAGERPQAPRR